MCNALYVVMVRVHVNPNLAYNYDYSALQAGMEVGVGGTAKS